MSLKVVDINNVPRGVDGLFTDIRSLLGNYIDHYDLTLAEVTGVLETVKQELVANYQNNTEDHNN